MSDRHPNIVNADPLDWLDCTEATRAAFPGDAGRGLSFGADWPTRRRSTCSTARPRCAWAIARSRCAPATTSRSPRGRGTPTS